MKKTVPSTADNPRLPNLNPSSIIPTDGSRVRDLRRTKGWTQDGLAERSGVDVRTIRRIETFRDETGPVPYPAKYVIVESLAKTLEAPVDEIIREQMQNPDAENAFAGSRQLAATVRSFREMASDASRAVRANNLIFAFIDAYLQRVLDGITPSKSRLEAVIDASAYQECLSRLTDDQRRQVRAFADLTDQTERNIWFASTDPATTWVRERTFWIDWSTVNDDKTFSKVVEMLQRQSAHLPKEYKVRLGVRDEWPSDKPHSLWPNAIGWHLLLDEESHLVGGYRRQGDAASAPQVILIADSGLSQKATKFYEGELKRTFAFSPSFDERAVRRAINEKTGVGKFEEKFQGRTRYRPPRYPKLYNNNIPIWVPCYADLIAECVTQVEYEVFRRINGSRSMNILEIGVGTGYLTKQLLPYIDDINYKAVAARHAPVVDRYLGIDDATQMLELVPQQILTNKLCEIGVGVFPTEYERVTKRRRVEIVFGSLVLHDILGPSVPRKKNLHTFLAAARDVVNEGGVLVFADAFCSPDKDLQVEQVNAWRKGMMRRGSTMDDCKTFFKLNKEMIDTVHDEELAIEAPKYGFRHEFRLLPPVANEENELLQMPFGLLLLWKVAEKKLKRVG